MIYTVADVIVGILIISHVRCFIDHFPADHGTETVHVTPLRRTLASSA